MGEQIRNHTVLKVDMVKHNNQVPNNHFKKDWQNRVRTWFNQPARKTRRRNARAEKAKKVFPRPVAGLLRPIVHAPTIRYNMKVRAGRGFTLEELKAAGVNRKEARSVGICVDHRRRNKSVNSLQENVARLRTYKAKLVVFPKRAGKQKNGDSDKAELGKQEQLKEKSVLSIRPRALREKARAITKDEKAGSVFRTLRIARSDARLFGKREKRQAEKDAEVAEKAKMGK